MTNKEALTILRIAYNEIMLWNLSDEEVEEYRQIGKHMEIESLREQSKRQSRNNNDSTGTES